MSHVVQHPYHLVDESPWPILRSLGALIITTGLVKWFHSYSPTLLITGLILILLIIVQWWRDVRYEGSFQGLHSSIVELGLRWGIVLFIVSEIFFFLSFFWAFFHRSLAPSTEIGAAWPPLGLLPFNPFHVPLLNTIVLLASGVTVTLAHHALIEGSHSYGLQALNLTIILGVGFTLLQALEYFEASFSIADRSYGSTFFIATGFHGLHVLVGTTFLAVCSLRHAKFIFRNAHHFGFEAAAWYWHFVDVVWLFLFITIYWWGGLFRSSIIYYFLLTIKKWNSSFCSYSLNKTQVLYPWISPA